MGAIERSLVARARPVVLAAKVRSILDCEAGKGCRSIIARQPVALEPGYQPIYAARALLTDELPSDAVTEAPVAAEHLVRLRLWIPSDYPADWRRSERFVKQLTASTHRLALEIVGNERQVDLLLLGHEHDRPVIDAAFYGEFARCELSPVVKDPFDDVPASAWSEAEFADYFPPPPYSHLLTRPDELQATPFESFITALARVPHPAIGFCQVLFQPVRSDHDWHHNIEVLLDLEYAHKLLGGMQLPQHYAQQAPSGDLRTLAGEVERKAHSDKPIFCAALRVGIVGADRRGPTLLRSLTTFTHLFQHGGRQFHELTHQDYKTVLGPQLIRGMFPLGLTFRPGFLVNSWELAGLVHLPPAGILDHRHIPLETLNTTALGPHELDSGACVGTHSYAGRTRPVCIPDDLRKRHVHVLGRSDTGKSVLLEHMSLDDIKHGAGVAVIDPHGDLIERLLNMLPEEVIPRTIYFDPGDPDWVPLWNPLQRIPGQDLGRIADDLVSALKSFVTGWGDRMERFFREVFYALLHLPHATLLDASNILQKSERSEQLQEQILEVVTGHEPRQFWKHEFSKYGKDDLGPPKNKLSKLLVGDRVPLMLSQPESAFNFREIMDQGMILLVNLSTVGSEVRGVLGCLILALIYQAAISRSNTPMEQRRPFHIFCDEAHRFVTDALEDVIAETRKYGVSLTLVHQYLRQFAEKQADALACAGTTVIFNVGQRDAGRLVKDLRGLFCEDDLISLEKFDAVLRAGNHIIRIETPEFERQTPPSHREAIIAESHRRYYRRAAEVRAAIERRQGRMVDPFFGPAPVQDSGGSEQLDYERL